MAAEDFNISIGLDTSAANKELIAFIGNSRKAGREARKALSQIKVPKIDLSKAYRDELKEVESIVKKINSKKRELGDSSSSRTGRSAKQAVADAKSPVKSSSNGAYGKELARLETRMLNIKNQLASLAKIPNPTNTDKLNVASLKADLATVQKSARDLKANAGNTFSEITELQKQLDAAVSDPAVVKAMEAEVKVAKQNAKARKVADAERARLLKIIQQAERSPEVVNAQKDYVSNLKIMRAQSVKTLQAQQQELNKQRVELTKAKDEASRSDITKKISKITLGMRGLNENIGFYSQEIEDLSDVSTNKYAGLKKDLRKMGVGGGNQPILGKPDKSGVSENLTPRSLSRLQPGGEQAQELKSISKVIKDAFLKNAQETGVTDPAQAVGMNPDQMGGVLKSLVFLAVEKMYPKKVTGAVLGEMQASTLENRKNGTNNAGGIAVVLEDATAGVEEITDAVSELETQIAKLTDTASENVNLANESRKGVKPKGNTDVTFSSANAEQDILRGGSRDATGEVIDAGEDRRRNIRDSNEGLKEILQFLSSGSVTKDRQTGFYSATPDSSTKIADEGRLKGGVISADEFVLAFEAATLAFKEIEQELQSGAAKGVNFSTLGPSSIDKAGMRGYYMSGLSRERQPTIFDDGGLSRDDELTDAESAKTPDLKRTLIIEPEQNPENKAALDEAFRSMIYAWAKSNKIEGLPNIENVKMRDVVDPMGGLSNPKSGTSAAALVDFIKANRDSSEVSNAKINAEKIGGAVGYGPTGMAIVSAIQQATAGVLKPTLQQQDLATSQVGDLEYAAMSEDAMAKFLRTLEQANSKLVDLAITYAALDSKVGVGEVEGGNATGLLNISSGRGLQGNPVTPDIIKLFNAANTGSRQKTVSATGVDGESLEVKIENIFADAGEKQAAPITAAFQRMALEFKAIYGGEMRQLAGETGNFDRETGLPAAPGSPNSAQATYGDAYARNSQNFMREMLSASTKAKEVDKTSEKGGGAEVPLDVVEGILAKIDNMASGGGAGMVEMETTDIATGKRTTEMVDLSTAVLKEARNALQKSTMGQPGRGGGVSVDGTLGAKSPLGVKPSVASTLVDKYGRQNIRASAEETVNGLAQGLTKGVSSVEQAGASTAIAFIDGYEGKMEIQSPSKRMKKSGEDTVDGLEQGLFQGLDSLDSAGRALAGTFHEGYTEQAKVDAVARIRQLKKEGMDIAAQQLQASMKRPPATIATTIAGGPVAPAKPVVPTVQPKFSSPEEIAARNQTFIQELEALKGAVEQNTDAIIALDIETTGPVGKPGDPKINRVFGYSVVGASGVADRDTGALPGTDVLTPNMRGMAHGMLVPPTGSFSIGAAQALGLQGQDKTNIDVKKNLIDRIKGLGYGKENTEGSEEAYIKQLEDIAFILRKIYEEDIPLAIHSSSLSDISGLGKEFARYGITAPTGGQLRDKGLLVETQRMAEMTGVQRGSRSVGDIYSRYTGRTMGPELIPGGNVPAIKDKAAVAHDPTIDSAATLVNAYTMRAVQEQAAATEVGLFGEAIRIAGATWKQVSSAIWGARQAKGKGNLAEPKGMQRQVDPVTGNLQPVYGPQPKPAASKPSTDIGVDLYETMTGALPRKPEADEQADAKDQAAVAQEAAKLRDDLEKERAKRRRLQANADLQYEADKIEELESMLKQALAEKDILPGSEARGKGVDRANRQAQINKLAADIKKAKADNPAAADALARKLAAKGGVESDFVATRQIVAKSELERDLEKKAKEAAARLDAASGEAKPAGAARSKKSGGNPIAAPLQELLDAEKRIQGSLQNPDAQLSPQLRKRLETVIKSIQKSIKAGAVGNLTGSELEVFRVPEGATKVKNRVAGKTEMNKIKKELEVKLKQAQESGNKAAIESVAEMLKEFDESLAKGPVGKYKNGRDAFAVPDSYRQATMTPAERTPSVLAAGGAMNPSRVNHAAMYDQKIQKDQLEARQASAQLQGQMKGEMRTMAEVEKANRKMMDGWISSRYALYDVSNTYQQFTRVMRRVGMEVKQAIMTNAAYETSFTSVERSMQPLQDEVAGMRQEIIKLTAELPVAFDELSRVTTLGAQMGIKADGITNFTEQVTKFSAITGLASDTVAQKFGRISQLAKVPSEDFNKLASAVSYAGISAVATDEEILTLTENIAAAASNSGFTADKIVGLATAMSSLGIAPEQARGVITRLFGDINRAVEGGGQPLAAYSKQLGMNAEATKALWKTDPQGFFKKMLDALAQSGNMTTALDALNIKETREVSTLQKLAENMDVYNQSMVDAQESYANGTFLGDSYAKTQDNIATKMTLVSNQIKMLQDAFGEALGPALTWSLDAILGILDGLNAIANNPVGAWAIRVATGLTAMAAAFVAYRMISMKATASLLAFRTAQVSLAKMGQADTGLKAFAKMITGQEVLIVRANGRVEVSNKKAIDSFKKLGMIKEAKAGTPEYDAIQSNMQPGRGGMDSMDEFGASATGSRLTDTEGGDRLIQTLDHQAAAKKGYVDETLKSTAATNAETASTKASSAAKTLDSLAVKDQANALVQQMGIKQAAIALKENENRALQAGIAAGTVDIAQSKAQIASNNAEIASMNAEIATLERRKTAILAGNAATAESVVVMDKAGVAAGRFGKAMAFAGPIMAGLTIVLGVVAAIAEAMDSVNVNIEESGGGLASFREAIYKDTQALKDGGTAFSTYQSKVTTSTTGFNDWAASLQQATGATIEAEGATAETTDTVKEQTLALSKNSAEWLANAAMQDEVVQNMFKDYFAADRDLAALAESAGTSMQSIIQAALTIPGSGAVDFINESFNSIAIDPSIAAKVKADLLNIAKSLDATTLAGVENSKIWKALIGNLETTEETAGGVGTGIEKVAEKVYTLTNYVSDLGGLLNDAFKIRYGLTEAIDKMAGSWKAVSDRLSEARKQLEAINQEIASMVADRNILEYQLKIAVDYGDTVRADKIRADIAKANSDIAEKEAGRAEAQQNASTKLTGMSTGAIQNRETMRGMISDYNNQMTEYANQYTSATNEVDRARIKAEADRLKADFIAKARALGFAENELTPYVKSFSDLKTIVNKLPNKLTLKVVADPGMRAWLEWWANNKDKDGTAVVTAATPAPATATGGGGADAGDGAGGTDGGGNDGKKPKPVVGSKITKKEQAALANLNSGSTKSSIIGDKLVKANSAERVFTRLREKGNYRYDRKLTAGDISDKNGFTAQDRAAFFTAEKNALTVMERQALERESNAQAIQQTEKALPQWVLDGISLLKTSKTEYTKYYSPFYDGTILDAKDAYKKAAKDRGVSEDPNDFKALMEQDKVAMRPYKQTIQTLESRAKAKAKQFADIRTLLNKNGFNATNLKGLLGETSFSKTYDSFATGGYVSGPGTGTSDSITANLSNGEFVQRQKAVQYYGLDFMNAINRLQVPRMPYANAAPAQSKNNIMVELSPNAVMQLMAMSNRPINLYSDDRQIATSANNGNRLLAMRGAN